MTNTDAILELVEEGYPDGICDDCLSTLAAVEPRQQVNQICRRLEGKGTTTRRRAECFTCGRIKLCNGLSQGVPNQGTSGTLSGRPATHLAEDACEPVLNLWEMRDHIVRFCRQLADQTGQSVPRIGPSQLISILRDSAILPAHPANMMLTIIGMRNCFCYEKLSLGDHEIAVANGAWAIVEEWTTSSHDALWREAARGE